MTSPASPTKSTTTVGEELFLVHLRRTQGQAQTEDRDLPPELEEVRKRTRANSIGEELWQVHLKRSRGYDEDEAQSPNNENHFKVLANDTTSGKRYNLRSKTPKK